MMVHQPTVSRYKFNRGLALNRLLNFTPTDRQKVQYQLEQQVFLGLFLRCLRRNGFN